MCCEVSVPLTDPLGTVRTGGVLRSPFPLVLCEPLSDGGGQIQEGITAALLPQLHCCGWVAEACKLCFG